MAIKNTPAPGGSAPGKGTKTEHHLDQGSHVGGGNLKKNSTVDTHKLQHVDYGSHCDSGKGVSG